MKKAVKMKENFIHTHTHTISVAATHSHANWKKVKQLNFLKRENGGNEEKKIMRKKRFVSTAMVKTVGSDGCSLFMLLCHSLYFLILGICDP